MSQGWIQLQLDIARENLREKNAFNTALANQRKREKKWYEGGIIGSVLGAIGGFLVGSVPGAIAGYNIGKEVGTQYHAHDDEDELSEELAAEVFGGGKFSKHQMREAVKDLKATVSDQYDALDQRVVSSAFNAFLGIKGAGGFMDETAKTAWQGMTFGEKIATSFGAEPLAPGAGEAGPINEGYRETKLFGKETGRGGRGFFPAIGDVSKSAFSLRDKEGLPISKKDFLTSPGMQFLRNINLYQGVTGGMDWAQVFGYDADEEKD